LGAMLSLSKWRVCCFLVVGALAFSCGPKPNDAVQQIRRRIQLGAQRAEGHNIGGIMALADDAFVAQPGSRSSAECKRLLWLAFKRYGEFRVLYPQPKVTLSKEKDRATAKVPFLIVKKDQSLPDLKSLYEDPQGWLEKMGDRGDLYQLSLEFAKRGSDWLVVRAHLRGGFQGFEPLD
jgi:hypothetical protein